MDRVLTFIVPFYNVESYIADCLESIYAQDRPENEYEVICVDDYSPDGSKAIVEEYQKKYSNLQLIEHEVNKGLGGARNTGLKNAKGKFVWFVDSDDMIKNEEISLLYKHLKVENVDVLLFNYERVNQIGIKNGDGIVFNDSVVCSGREFVDSFFGSTFIHHLGYVWRCIYKTEYLLQNKFFFPENTYWEDTVFFPKTLLFAKEVVSLKNVFYKYRVNDDSISGKNNQFKADRFYQFSIVAGMDLYDFSQEYMQIDELLASALREKSIWYFNSFTKPLSFCKYAEKKRFYTILHRNKLLITEIINFISLHNRLLLNPFLGIIFSYIYRIAYVIKDKSK